MATTATWEINRLFGFMRSYSLGLCIYFADRDRQLNFADSVGIGREIRSSGPLFPER